MLLSEAAYRATLAAPMTDVTDSAEPVVDIWPYIDALPEAEGLGDVDRVYRSGTGDHDHVLITTSVANAYLVVIVDLRQSAVLGHYRLDLNWEYERGE